MKMSNLAGDIFAIYLHCTVLLPLQFFMCKLGPPVFVSFVDSHMSALCTVNTSALMWIQT